MLSIVSTVVARGGFPFLYLMKLSGNSLPVQSNDNSFKHKHKQNNNSFDKKIENLQEIYGIKGQIHLRCHQGVNAAYEIENNFFDAIGNNLAVNSPKVISFASYFQKTDEEACKFWLSYACCQIKNNDAVLKYAVLLVINLAASFFCSPVYIPVLVGISSHVIITNTLGTYSLNRAFSTTLQHASKEEIEGVHRFLNARLTVEKQISGHSALMKINIWIRHILFGTPPLKNLIRQTEHVLKTKYSSSRNFSNISGDPRYKKMYAYLTFKEMRM